MYPPPTTSIVSGMSASSKHPVESITRSESIASDPGRAGLEPVARIRWSKVSWPPSGTEPSSPSSCKVVEFTSDPRALMNRTLRRLASWRAAGHLVDHLFLASPQSLQVDLGRAETDTPVG